MEIGPLSKLFNSRIRPAKKKKGTLLFIFLDETENERLNVEIDV